MITKLYVTQNNDDTISFCYKSGCDDDDEEEEVDSDDDMEYTEDAFDSQI